MSSIELTLSVVLLLVTEQGGATWHNVTEIPYFVFTTSKSYLNIPVGLDLWGQLWPLNLQNLVSFKIQRVCSRANYFFINLWRLNRDGE